MNLLILPSWYDTPDNSVRGIFFKEQAQALLSYFKKNNIDATVTILALQQYNIRERRLYKGIKKVTISEENGITTVRARMFHIPKLEEINFRRGAAYLKKLVMYTQKITGLEFSLIHIHSVQFAGIWYALSGLKIPYVITEHSSAFFRNRIGKAEKKYLPKVFDNAKSVIAVGKGLADKIQIYSKQKVKVIFNIVKDVPFSNFEHLNRDERFVFFSLGYDIQVKGFDILLNAFSKFLKDNTALLILGGLTEESQKVLQNQAESLGIQKNLILMGRINHDDVYKMMKHSCSSLPGSTRIPDLSVTKESGPPVLVAITGRPTYIDSAKTIPKVSKRLAKTKQLLCFIIL